MIVLRLIPLLALTAALPKNYRYGPRVANPVQRSYVKKGAKLRPVVPGPVMMGGYYPVPAGFLPYPSHYGPIHPPRHQVILLTGNSVVSLGPKSGTSEKVSQVFVASGNKLEVKPAPCDRTKPSTTPCVPTTTPVPCEETTTPEPTTVAPPCPTTTPVPCEETTTPEPTTVAPPCPTTTPVPCEETTTPEPTTVAPPCPTTTPVPCEEATTPAATTTPVPCEEATTPAATTTPAPSTTVPTTQKPTTTQATTVHLPTTTKHIPTTQKPTTMHVTTVRVPTTTKHHHGHKEKHLEAGVELEFEKGGKGHLGAELSGELLLTGDADHHKGAGPAHLTEDVEAVKEEVKHSVEEAVKHSVEDLVSVAEEVAESKLSLVEGAKSALHEAKEEHT